MRKVPPGIHCVPDGTVTRVLVAGGEYRFELVYDLVDRETRSLLPRRELLERGQELRDDGRGREREVHAVDHPFPVAVRRHVGALERIHAEIEELRHPEHGEWLG